MTTTTTQANPTATLAELAIVHPAASRVFHRHGLDFCCHGARPLGEACGERGLDPAAIMAEVDAEDSAGEGLLRWDRRPLSDLIDHIVGFYHRRLREELPLLVELAAKVEARHADKPARPRGLADHLAGVHQAVLDHLAKEEQVLFPLILAGRGPQAGAPIHVMELEHEDHARNLARTRALTADLVAPPEACTSWRALYLRLEQLERELMEHIHLENNVLFKRALCA